MFLLCLVICTLSLATETVAENYVFKYQVQTTLTKPTEIKLKLKEILEAAFPKVRITNIDYPVSGTWNGEWDSGVDNGDMKPYFGKLTTASNPMIRDGLRCRRCEKAINDSPDFSNAMIMKWDA